ncbi:OmpA family protein [Tardiphaga sp.]|uniref:OmpA family protein n=1 Tax=Tardiphaga sp. TaxID=1926292 RepID=UPI0019C4DB41|nr:OmpA family protein [Tardiphaga sp.]MBC7577720.1 OmpA family protein [Tardiphaga sp.]
MSTTSGSPNLRSLRVIALICVAFAVTTGMASAADDVTSDQILRALAPKKPLTRSLSVTPPAEPAVNAAEGKFVDALRNRTTRSLSAGEREQIAAIAETKPRIDLEITFDYDSATISAKAQPAVQALGKALSSDELKGSTFILAGHTDAVGGETYNQDLSERRADAIKRYLTDKYGLAGADLVTVGYGKNKPKPGTTAADPSNRRVQVVNMANKTTAAR